MNALDFVWPIVVILGFILGYRKGFFASVTKPIKLVAALSLTVLVALPVINLIKPFFINKIASWMNNTIVEAGISVTDELPTAIKFFADLLRIDTNEIATLEGVVTELSGRLGGFVAIIISYVSLFIIFILLLKLVIALFDIAFRKGMLGKINSVLGLILGGAIAFVAASILVNIVGAFASGVIQGPISQFFKNFNPLVLLLEF